MKKLINLFVILMITTRVLAQPPEKMIYQAVLRDAGGNLITDKQVGMRITILEGALPGIVVYQETQTPITNANGLSTIEIGGGTGFDTINWGRDIHFIKIETDPNGSTNYTISATSQLMSVPYAFYANEVKFNDDADADSTNEIQSLILTNNILSLTKKGGSINLPSQIIPQLSENEILALIPETGQLVFNKDISSLQYYDGINWQLVQKNCWPEPTTANAGPDQFLNGGITSATLAANIPELNHGTGSWNILSGEGGSFDDPTKSNSVFTGSLFVDYTLQWTISTACSSSKDQVHIMFCNNGPHDPVTDFEGNVYKTVSIGSQIWMAENMRTIKYNNGTDIPNVTDGTEWSNLTTPGYCWYYNDKATYGTAYGALYNWYTVNTGQLCPNGWHVPSEAECTALEEYLIKNGYGYGGSGSEIAKSLASKTLWESSIYPGTPGNVPESNNSSGFSGLPGGCRNDDGGFSGLGTYGFWWSTTGPGGYASSRRLSKSETYLLHYSSYKKSGFSVRCLRD